MGEAQAAEAVMRQSLAAADFDFDRPDPRLAWAAFRAFAARPLPGVVTVNVGVECYNAADRDGVLWLEFARSLEGGRGSQIWSVDVTGRNERRVLTPGSASDPAWSPLIQ